MLRCSRCSQRIRLLRRAWATEGFVVAGPSTGGDSCSLQASGGLAVDGGDVAGIGCDLRGIESEFFAVETDFRGIGTRFSGIETDLGGVATSF